PLGEPVGRAIRRNPIRTGDLEDAEYGVIDLVRLAERTLGIPSSQLAVHVDHAAGVGNVVRRVQDVALLEHVAVALFQQLVVGSAGDDLDLELGNGRIVDDST